MKTKAELIRENKYLSARNDYGLNARKGYPRIMDETDRQICNAFEAGKNWADENPKPGLVDIEKAVKWLEDNINNYIFNDTYQLHSGEKSMDWFKIKSECFSDFRNAMEK